MCCGSAADIWKYLQDEEDLSILNQQSLFDILQSCVLRVFSVSSVTKINCAEGSIKIHWSFAYCAHSPPSKIHSLLLQDHSPDVNETCTENLGPTRARVLI